MAETKVLNPKSFRITDDIAEKFKEISKSIGGNQQETLTALIDAYELKAGQEALPQRSEDISQFRKYAAVLTRLYVSALEESTDMNKTVHAEYEARLQAKDQIIMDLQKRVKAAEKNVDVMQGQTEKMMSDYTASETEKHNLKTMIEELQATNTQLQERANELEKQFVPLNEHILTMQQQNISNRTTMEEMTKKINSYESIIVSLKEKLQSSEQVNKQLTTQVEIHETEIESTRQAAYENARQQVELLYEKQLFEQEKKHMEYIRNLNDTHTLEINKYHTKYTKLVEKFFDNQE